MRSRKGLTEGLREFIHIDNQRALEVGHLSQGMGTFKVRKQKVSRRMPGGNGQEHSDELMLRAEDVGTLKAYVNVDHIEKERWAPFG